MDYDIYREELAIKHPTYGHALWEPNPGGRYTSVEIGDVGFIRQGSFHRLFNILLPEDHLSHQDGVPQDHEPLILRTTSHTTTGQLQPNNLRSGGVSDTSDEDRLAATGPDEAAGHSFSCSKKRGAILSLPLPAQRTDTAARGDFARRMIRDIDVWFAFAQQRGFGINRDDIILVTGCHLARSWATIAFQEKGDQVAFGYQVSGNSNVTWQFKPKGPPYNLGPSGENLPENQCIFIRGFRASQFSRMIPPKLRGGAGPSDPGSDPDPDCDKNDTQLPGIPTDTSYQDPLCTLLEYISMQAPGCEVGLIHDDDLQNVCSSSLESLRPDALMGHLQIQAPLVFQYSCDFPPTGKSEPKAPSLTIATLSKFDIAEFKPVVSDEMASLSDKGKSEAKASSLTEALSQSSLADKPKPAVPGETTSPSDTAKSEPKVPSPTAATLSQSNPADESKPVVPSETTSPSKSEPNAPSSTAATLAQSDAADESKPAVSGETTSPSDKGKSEPKAPSPTTAALSKPDESQAVVSGETTSPSDKGKSEAKAPSPPAPAALSKPVIADEPKPVVSGETTSPSDKGKSKATAPPPTAAATFSKLDSIIADKITPSEMTRRETTISEVAVTKEKS